MSYTSEHDKRLVDEGYVLLNTMSPLLVQIDPGRISTATLMLIFVKWKPRVMQLSHGFFAVNLSFESSEEKLLVALHGKDWHYNQINDYFRLYTL